MTTYSVPQMTTYSVPKMTTYSVSQMGCQSMQTQQCCALVNNKRCALIVIGDSKHCHLHHDTAVKLYLKYKKICNRVEKISNRKLCGNINECITQLMCYYDILNKAYDARMAHRMYAVAPDCYDDGHNEQFEKIQGKISECEESLQKLFDIAIQSESVSKSKSKPDIDDTVPDQSSKSNAKTDIVTNTKTDIVTNAKTDIVTNAETKVREYRDKRKRDFDKEQQNVDDYLRDLQVYRDVKENYDKDVINNLSKIYPIIGDAEYGCTFLILYYHLIDSLDTIKFFDDNFRFKKCNIANCTECVSHDFLFKCKCFDAYKTVESFFASRSMYQIQQFAKTIVEPRNIDKNYLIYNDLLKLYAIMGPRLFTIKIVLSWSMQLGRFELSNDAYYDYGIPSRKPSQKFALERRKKSVKNKNPNYDYVSSSDSDDEF